MSAVTFPTELFIVMGMDYRYDPQLGHTLHNIRLHWEKVFGWRTFEFYGLLYQRYGWGRELVFVGKKEKAR